MKYPSQLLNAYHDCFYPSDEGITPIELATLITQEAWTHSQKIYNQIIISENPRVMKFVKENYFPDTWENGAEEIYTGLLNTKWNVLFKSLSQKNEMSADKRGLDNTDTSNLAKDSGTESNGTSDNFNGLKNELKKINCKRRLKAYQIDGIPIYQIYTEKSPGADYLASYFKRLNQVIKLLENDTEKEKDKRRLLFPYIIEMIHMVLSDHLLSDDAVPMIPNYFSPAMNAFQYYIPNTWRECVDFYFIMKIQKIIPESFSDKKGIYVLCKNAYPKIIYSAAIELISSNFIQENRNKTGNYEFNNLWHYFGGKQAFKSHFVDYIYDVSYSVPKNKLPDPDYPLLHKIYYFGIASLIMSIRAQYMRAICDNAEDKKNRIEAFWKTINLSNSADTLSEERMKEVLNIWASASNMESADIFLSEKEKPLVDSIIHSLEVLPAEQHLLLFTGTEAKIGNKKGTVNTCLADIEIIKNDYYGRSDINNPGCKNALLNELSPVLTKLVSECDKIKVNFSAFDILRNLNLNLNKEKFTLNLLRAYETEYINFLKADLYYVKDVREKNYQAIRDSLRFRSNNILNSSVFDIYKHVAYRVETSYKSYKERESCTERDLLAELNNYAYSRLKKELGAETKPIKLNHSTALVSSNILNEKLEFASRDEQIACAAMGFTEGSEGAFCITSEFTNRLLGILKMYCSKQDHKQNHLQSVSKDCLTFGIVSILALAPLRKKRVISNLCMEANKISMAKDRLVQETIIVLLNIILIQPKARLDSTTSVEILDTIFKRVLYPDQLSTIGRIEKQPYLKSQLAEKKRRSKESLCK